MYSRSIGGDFARTDPPAAFDLAIGNPPFSDRTVRSDRAYRSLGLRLKMLAALQLSGIGACGLSS